jgi:phosphate-selective porin OprO/OprP
MEPLPFVKRVVFISTPHRGTYLVGNFARRWARRLMSLPGAVVAAVLAGDRWRSRLPADREATAARCSGVFVSFDSIIAMRSNRRTGFLSALIAGTFIEAGLFAQDQAVGNSATKTNSSANSVVQAESGPESLRQQNPIAVGTNSPVLGAAGSATNAPKKNFEWQYSWDGWDGLHFEVANKTLLGRSLTNAFDLWPVELKEVKMSGKIGGKLAVDGAAYAAGNQFQGFDAGAEVRRARLYAKGDCMLLLPVSYQIEIGYIPNQFYIEESYLLFRDIKYFGDLKLGQYQAPMGLVTYGSSRDMTFMEPASVLQALAPGVNAGLQVGRPVVDQRMTWALGLFTDGVGQDFGDASKDFGRVVGRITGLPIYRRDSEKLDSQQLLHLGLSGNVLYAGSSSVRYQSRPESHQAPYVVDTGSIDADSSFAFGAEAAWVNGPLSVQGEYLRSWVRANNGSDVSFGGFYATASWFLTGESRPYDRVQGTFTRVIPKHNFNWGKGGWGAWEIAGRYSFANLNSGDIEGGRMSMLMGEVNWYLHSHVKWRFNYGLGHVAGRQPEGNLNIFQTRVEVDF